MNDWKVMFSEQRAKGISVWRDPLVKLRLPKIYNLRRDPFERAEVEGIGYERWMADHLPMIYKSAAKVKQFVGTFKEFPQRQRPASFSIDQIIEGFNK
jgi:hypothetical protein